MCVSLPTPAAVAVANNNKSVIVSLHNATPAFTFRQSNAHGGSKVGKCVFKCNICIENYDSFFDYDFNFNNIIIAVKNGERDSI